jgi:hypothetical protein
VQQRHIVVTLLQRRAGKRLWRQKHLAKLRDLGTT